MTGCPHSGLRVGDRCYWCCKTAATNGYRSRLSVEQLAFVGFLDGEEPSARAPGWAPATTTSATLLEQQEELARLLDVMPNWVRLAREIVNPK